LFEWVRDGVDTKVISDEPKADSVVIFGHADPTKAHSDFFDPLTAYLKEDKVSDVPFLYLNGDAHKWNYKSDFYGQSNFLRIQVEGGTREPPLQVTLDNSKARTKPPSEVFVYDRMLSSSPSLDSVTRFYAIGDVPYTQRETTELITQIEELEDDAEFLIHVGDIRNARNKTECTIQQYYEVADILNKSHAPVFIVLGGESNGGDRRNNESRVFIPYLRNPIASTFYFQTTSGMIVST
jgi:hypothetical protein